MKIYETKDLLWPSLLEGIFGKKPKMNAVIEINNLLAAKELFDIKPEEILAISLKYKVKPVVKFPKEIKELYKTYLKFCFIDAKLEDMEKLELIYLKNLLGLNDVNIEALLDEMKEEIYEDHVKKVFSDDKLEEHEREFLEKLRKELLLDDKIASRIYAESATALLQKVVNTALEDKRLSEDEEHEIEALAKHLNIAIPESIRTDRLLNKYRLLWQIQNGIMPLSATRLNLKHKEKCLFNTKVNWMEPKGAKKEINSSAAVMRIKIAKGTFWHEDELADGRASKNDWHNIEAGDAYLTNLHIIFISGPTSKSIDIRNITDFIPSSDGIELHLRGRNNVFLEFHNYTDLFSLMLGKMIDGLPA